MLLTTLAEDAAWNNHGGVGHRFAPRDRPLLMGILNVTPDSFSDGYHDCDRAIRQGLQLAAEGSDIIDIGGESTRPGSDSISEQMELDRVLPVIEALRERIDTPLSIDTQKPGVAKAAIAAGVCIVNHVSGTLDLASMIPLLRASDVGYVLMHMPQRPKTMQEQPLYGDVVSEVGIALEKGLQTLIAAGIEVNRILIDPGIGFGKRLEHNLALMQNLVSLVKRCGRPLLMGVSRKSWLLHLLGEGLDWKRRDAYSAMASVLFPFPEVLVHRVHDVGLTKHAFAIKSALNGRSPSTE